MWVYTALLQASVAVLRGAEWLYVTILHGLLCMQGHPVRLETANAALLEGSGETWADAFANDSDWKLVGILVP